MKIFKFNWSAGWNWDCKRIQRLARWIDNEANNVLKHKKEN